MKAIPVQYVTPIPEQPQFGQRSKRSPDREAKPPSEGAVPERFDTSSLSDRILIAGKSGLL